MEGKKVIMARGQKFTNILELLGISKSDFWVGKNFLVLVNTTSRNPFSMFAFMVWEVYPPPFPNENKGLGELGSGFKIKVGRGPAHSGQSVPIYDPIGDPIPYTLRRYQTHDTVKYIGGTRRHRVHGHLQGFECKCRDGVPPLYNTGTKGMNRCRCTIHGRLQGLPPVLKSLHNIHYQTIRK